MDYKTLLSARRRCVACIAAIRGAGSIVRVVPIAFPVFQSTWRISIRVEKDTGTVERHLLGTLQRLGPVSSGKLRNVTGLERGILEKAFEDLKALGVPVECQDGRWTLSGNANILYGHVERQHDFAFLSNGLTGDFLPLTQHPEVKAGRVSPEEIKTLRLHALQPVCGPGEGKMPEAIGRGGRAHEYLDVGIPEGFAGFVSPTPQKQRLWHVLAFGFEFVDGSFEILSSGESGYRFGCPAGDTGQYRGEARPPERPALAGLKISDTDNIRRVAVEDESLWEESAAASRPDSPAGLVRQMIWPGWTCDPDRSFHLLVAGNGKTARTLAVQRGCSMLRNAYASIKTGEDLERMAECFAEETKRNMPGTKAVPAFTEVLEAAQRTQDQDLVDFARRFLPVAKENRIAAGRPPQAFFLRSQGTSFHEMLVGAIRNAKKSIRLAVPVLDDDGIFEALEDAVRRDVEISIATQLPDHRTRRVKTDPQFKDCTLPRRKLAALGARLRDCDHTIHAKFGVIDSQLMFVTSANLNANSLGVGGANSLEVAVAFDDGLVARAGEDLFREIWNHARYEQVRHDEHISILRRPRVGEMRLLACLQTPRDATFLLSTPENGLLARKMAGMVAGAEKRVRLATMSLYDLKEVPVLFEALTEALRRKVKIQIAVRPPEEMHFSSEQWPDPSTKELTACGLEIVQVPHLHAKGMVVDRMSVMMTSANFNPYSLGNKPTSHIELGLAGTTATPCLSAFSDFVDELLESGRET